MSVEALEAFYQRGQYSAAVKECHRLLADPPDCEALTAARTLYFGAVSAFRLGLVQAAARWIEQALDEARSGGDSLLLGRTRFQAGEIYRSLGDTRLAEQAVKDFLYDLHWYPELEEYRGAAHYNLGLIYRQRNEMNESLTHYRQALDLLKQTSRWEWLVMACQNYAWVLSETGDTDHAAEVLVDAETWLEKIDNRQLRLSQMLSTAHILLHVGRPTEATAACQEVFAPGSGATDAQIALAAWILGECALRLGHKTEAERAGQLANEYAMRANDPRVMNYSTALLARLASPGDQPSESA